MTYISRRTRIIVSRWTDECDADYILRAVRKRSDGRIKRYSSCDDLRAWVNDYCIKHEHLVDLMSSGEVSGPPAFRLYGRFIPVPILFKLMQRFQNNDFVNIKEQSKKAKDNLGSRRSEGKRSGVEISCKDCKKSAQSLNKNETSTLENNSVLSRVQWEKNRLEKNLYESTNLLSLALSKLEKIDNIIDYAKEETDNAKNEEIQFAYCQSQAEFDNYDANQPNGGNVSDELSSSRTYVKKLKDSAKCSKLLRKISDLREKLRKVQECRQIITRQIHMSRMNAIKHESLNQVTELYNRREECRMKKLKKKLEKLIAERGRLLSEMCEALNDLNTLKRISRSSLSQKKCSKVSDREEIFKCGLRESARCTCGCNCPASSRDLDVNNSDSPSESDLKECVDHIKQMCPWNTSSESPIEYSGEKPPPRPCLKRSSRSTGVLHRCAQDSTLHYCKQPEIKPLRRHFVKSSQSTEQSSTPNTEVPNQESSKSSLTNRTTSYSNSTEPKVKRQQSSQILEKPQISNKVQKSPERVKSPDKIFESVKNTKNTKRSSKVNFVEEESYCRKKYYQDDLTVYENSVSPQQQKVIQKALKRIESRRSKIDIPQESEKRPTSSPTTEKERRRISFESHRHNVQDLSKVTSPERRVKSETTMQEIEKTLRNYEQRLKKYDGLENKIEEIRRKVTQVNRIKLEWERQRSEGHRELESERDRSSQEISKLSTENWALKKQIQKLMAKFEVQCRKIQTLKCNAQKNWELECETEELKKELVKYRDTFEHQRKCITKWESVVLLQRKEIENLMNHIRRLSAECNYSTESQSPEMNFQRSRSYSPKLPKPQTIISRAKMGMKEFRSSSDDEEEPYYYSQCQQIENSRSSQEGSFYYPDLQRRKNW